MVKTKRGLTTQQRAELWRRWKDGQSLSDIGRALEKPPGSVHGFLGAFGGIAPAARTRSPLALTGDEREEISRQVCVGSSLRQIARKLNRAPSTISREIRRNGGRETYRAGEADSRAWARGRRPKLCRLRQHRRLKNLVARKLELDWSPEQISGWLRRTFPKDAAMQISHETIYKSLFVQARGVLKRGVLRHLRSRRIMRKAGTATTANQERGRIIDAVSIHDRPAEVEDRSVPGHWEGDLMSGSNNSHIATLVERKTRFTKLVKLAGKDASSVVNALSKHLRTLPKELRRTLTWDRGQEMAQHRKFSIATNVDVYFCDPRSPWQRGTNENTNRLLRQYLPDGTDLSLYSQAELDEIARLLNGRPRKTLEYLSPAESS